MSSHRPTMESRIMLALFLGVVALLVAARNMRGDALAELNTIANTKPVVQVPTSAATTAATSHRSQAATEVAPLATSEDHEDAAGSLEWKGTNCLGGTLLTAKTLPTKCKAGEIGPTFCAAIAADTTKEVCGQYAGGRFGALPPTSEIAEKLPATGARSDCPLASLSGRLGGKSVKFDKSTGRLGGGQACPSFSEWSPTEALTILAAAAEGRGILFTGDSMMRQLYLRLISTLRGENVVADHYFHQDAVYTIRTDGTDMLTVLDAAGKTAMKTVLQTRFKKGAQVDANDGIVLAMMFQWDTKPSAHRSDFLDIDPPLHIAAFMYWWSNKDKTTDLDPCMAKVNARGEALTQASSSRRYVYVTTPWTAPKTFGGVEDANRLPRNNKAADWITSKHKAGGLEMMLLDFAAIAEEKPFPKTKDGIHYACIWTPKWPQLANNQKYNFNGCRDPMNAGVAQWLLHMLWASLRDQPAH